MKTSFIKTYFLLTISLDGKADSLYEKIAIDYVGDVALISATATKTEACKKKRGGGEIVLS